MMLLDRFIASGFVTVFVLAILALEAIVFLVFFKRLRGMLPTLAAGACLILALRSALVQYNSAELALWLGLGFVFHILEIWQWLKMSKRQPQ